MALTEIPHSGYTYRVQPLDKDQASQQENYRRREKKKKEVADKTKESQTENKGNRGKVSRINLIA